MKYLGWIISIVLIIVIYYTYKTQYVPIKTDLDKLEEEIAMWENVLKGEKGMDGTRDRFAIDRFFRDDRLSPYGEVEILRKFDQNYTELEIYISAPHAITRATDVIAFLADQKLVYENFTCYVVIDSIERFEYKLVK
ncbi:hypothetical protein AMJ52_02925 [candidate division TA06 bacterium DG_78]|uniref:Uncharacterized protein n=1 Tax=candidate division TA06 bacterium DG_78 TaxID=1703772 RepID=A0A0S7YGE0_UNCT6|nr:MAG: hypothetical protein AMJ52_02925 [candidate division TA06 bacterium DG_78]